MRVISAESLWERTQIMLNRRRLVVCSVAAGTSVLAVGRGSVLAQEATPAAIGTPISGAIQRNPWEPEWSAEPAFFEVVSRNDEIVVVESFQDGLQEFPANASRIFLMSGEEDIFIALGIEDRIAGIVADLDGVPYYTNQVVAEEQLDFGKLVLSDNIYEPNLELILSAEPDLILGQGLWVLTDDLYPQVAGLAPTLRYPAVTFLYPRQAVHDFGKLFGVEEQVTDALESYNDTMQRARAAVASVANEAEVVTLWYQGEGIFIVYPGWSINPTTGGIEASSSVSSPIFFELGMKPLAAVEALADEDREQFYVEMSVEQFGKLDPDYLFISGDPGLIESEMMQYPIVQQMRAVQDNNVVVIDDTGSLGLGYFGNLAQISLIAEALTGVPFE